MIIFLYGQDTYRSRQRLNELVEDHKKAHKSGLNLRHLDGRKLGYQDFKDEFQQTSMFKEKKLIILKNVFSNQEFKKSFLENSKNLLKSDDVILLHEEGDVPRSDAFFKFLIKDAEAQEFELLGGQKLKNWIRKEFEKSKAAVDPQAVEKLIGFAGNDLWRLSNEISKLASYKKGQEIEVKDIILLVKPKIETDIFKTIDAISSKNKRQAINLIHRHIEKGDNPLYLLSMINFQFRNILEIRELMEKDWPYYRISKQSKLHPYVVKKSYEQARQFTFEELKKIYQKIFQVDYKIKTGRLEAQTALDLLIAEI